MKKISKQFFGMKAVVIGTVTGKREDGSQWNALKVFMEHSGGIEELFISLSEAWAKMLDGSRLVNQDRRVFIDYTAEKRLDGSIARYLRGIFDHDRMIKGRKKGKGKADAQDQADQSNRPDPDSRPAPEVI